MKLFKTTQVFFTKEEERKIVSAITQAESDTSGEIRVHLAKSSKDSVQKEAIRIFEKIGMTQTAEKNGVLIYLSLAERQFAVIGDSGIHEKVTDAFWEKIRDAIQRDFKQGKFAEGLIDGILTCGEELSKYFPRKSDDRNELPDTISKS